LAKNYAFGGIKKQEEKLEKEGIEFVNGKVKLSKHLWKIKN
jgi:alkylated DNA nucleotide flippase Atl1